MRRLMKNKFVAVLLIALSIISAFNHGQSYADSYQPISISVTLDKDELSVGETITATYEITGGNGDYSGIQLQWMELVTGNESWHSVKSVHSWNGIDIPPINILVFLRFPNGIAVFHLVHGSCRVVVTSPKP